MGGVVVAWLDPGTVRGEFTESVIRLLLAGTMNGQIVGFMRVESGPLLDVSRNAVTEQFLATDADWLLMLDSDMVFEHDLLERLLDHADALHRPMVGALCFGVDEGGPFPTMYRAKDNRFYQLANPAVDELVSVDATGTAAVLVHRGVFRRLAEEFREHERWFDRLVIDGEIVGEDMAFSARVHNAGIPMFVHTGIEVGHVKSRVVTNQSFVDYRVKNRFVVTGTGRCGTKYLAELFAACQIPCLHEQVFTVAGPRDWFTVRADSSWLAAPYLQDFAGTVIHLVRNPLHVVRSLVGVELFEDSGNTLHDPYQEFIKRHGAWSPTTDDPVELASRFVVDWNDRIAPYADVTVRVEDLTPEVLRGLLERVGSKPALPFVEKRFATVPLDLNARRRAVLEWSDVPAFLKDHAEALGYAV